MSSGNCLDSGREGYSQMPGGFKVAEPMVDGAKVLQTVREETGRLVGTSIDFFRVAGGGCGPLTERIRHGFESETARILGQSDGWRTGFAVKAATDGEDLTGPLGSQIHRLVQVCARLDRRAQYEPAAAHLKYGLEALLKNENTAKALASGDPKPVNELIRTYRHPELACFLEVAALGKSAGCYGPLAVKNVGFDVGEPAVVYHPYAVTLNKQEVIARDLYSGETIKGGRNPYPELDGFRSIWNKTLSGHPAAASLGILADFNRYAHRIGRKTENVIIRRPCHKADGELWYFPMWQVPVTVAREAQTTVNVERRDSRHTLLTESLELSARFDCRGAILFDGLRGMETERFLNDAYFDRSRRSSREPNVSSRVVRTSKRRLPWLRRRHLCWALGVLGISCTPGLVALAIRAVLMASGWLWPWSGHRDAQRYLARLAKMTALLSPGIGMLAGLVIAWVAYLRIDPVQIVLSRFRK